MGHVTGIYICFGVSSLRGKGEVLGLDKKFGRVGMVFPRFLRRGGIPRPSTCWPLTFASLFVRSKQQVPFGKLRVGSRRAFSG
jgi:hypothetical protein